MTAVDFAAILTGFWLFGWVVGYVHGRNAQWWKDHNRRG